MRREKPKPRAHARYHCGGEPGGATAAVIAPDPYAAAERYAEACDAESGGWAECRVVYVRGPTGPAVAYTVRARRVSFYEAKKRHGEGE